MAFTIERLLDDRLVVIRMQGNVTAEDLDEVEDFLAPDGHYTVPNRLWDFRGCEVDMATEELKRRTAEAKTRDRERGYVAAVVDREFHFGLGRMAGVFRESELTRFQVFRDDAEALRWLRMSIAAGGDSTSD